jgi:hypothetical protein
MSEQPKHTPGPWRWEVNEKGKSVQLCGGVPRYDKTVMDFVRWGMGGATPRFRDSSDHGLLTKCIKWAKAVIGREHHAHWHKGLDHPDARLIAAAPDQNQEMRRYLPVMERAESDPELWARLTEGLGIATLNGYRAAIAKAEGRGE